MESSSANVVVTTEDVVVAVGNNKSIQPGDNPDLTAERMKATFDTDAMAAVIYGSEQAATRRREISAAVSRIGELADSKPLPFMSRDEKVTEAARKQAVLMKHLHELIDPTDPEEELHVYKEVIGIEGHPLALHYAMFVPALEAQASREQLEKWLGRAKRGEIVGCYAQTELGHGTHLRRLETTATYDVGGEQFVLHTPTATALKWWPGGLGKSSNYAIVMAQMVVRGENLGPHPFLVQLRDEHSHRTLPGVTIGDIGPKMAYNAADNGFLGFNNYRIPLSHLLSRHAQVTRDGTYLKPKHHAKMNYSAMVRVRSHMTSGNGCFLAHALTIAIRYSAVRRQGFLGRRDEETRVLDYQTQQHRLFPALARAYAFMFTGVETIRLYERLLADQSDVALMADLHALTSGLKSVVTHQTGEGIEQARMACGGHGYSQASYLSEIYGVAIGGCTYEGENMVMLLQLARYLVKSAALVRTGHVEKLAPLVAYLGRKSDDEGGVELRNGVQEYVKTFEHVSRRQTMRAAEKFWKALEEEQNQDIAWNNCAVELTRASRLHTRLFIVEAFVRRVADVSCPRLREVLTDLLRLHVNYELLDVGTYALEDGFLSLSQLEFVREQLYASLAKLRPNAVSLVDSFQFSDMQLRSVLGRRDGHVYTNLVAWAQASPLNEHDVLPAVQRYLKPMMTSKL